QLRRERTFSNITMTKRQASRLPFSLPATSVDEDTSTVVPIEAFTVVIRASTLQPKYDGGVDGFASEWGNRTFCSDGQLVRIGIMVDTDVTAFLGELADRGLTPADDDGAVDVAVISQSGLERPCDWL